MARSLLPLLFTALLAAQTTGNWKIDLQPKAPLKAGPAVPIHVTLKNADGAPVAGASVELVLTMVDMDHGETKASARESTPGVYAAEAKFMMEGKWNIEVRAKKGSDSASMKKQVDVK